nr:coiled-coil domain-containing protein 30 isoform X2 [Nothobranchius furzeri]
MDQAEVLDQISSWMSEEGLAPNSSKEDWLCFMWLTLQHTKKRLSNVTKDLETNRAKHLAEMAEVRKSLGQIRIFTEQKDALAQEIQDENDQLRKQLQHLISLQDAQISEVAKMLYQQGLTELIHSSPSEQVAYLLVERDSLLETNEDPSKLSGDGNLQSSSGTQAVNAAVCQSTHKRAPQHLQNAWKRLFGFHRRHAFMPPEATSLAGQACSLEKQCSRLERDVEEGSRRLAMSHKEIRRLTDELESAHLTQKAYEPELQSAQQEVDHLREEVEHLKKYEMAELRKTKELNDRLDHEIRALRNRVRFLDAEKNAVQQTVAFLQEEVEKLKSEQQEGQTGETKVRPHKETDEVRYPRIKAEQLESALQEQHQKLHTVQAKANQVAEVTKCRETNLIRRNETGRDEHEKLKTDTECSENQSEMRCLQLVDHRDQNHLTAKICIMDQKVNKQNEADRQLSKNTSLTKEHQKQLWEENMPLKECSGCQELRKTLSPIQEECESLKKEICETLKCLDKERSKYHSMKEKYKEKVCQAEHKFDDETSRRDEKIKNLERNLSLCSHSLTKERELVVCITEENEKLLDERRKLLWQLNEAENNTKESHFTASLFKSRVDYLETENNKLGNKILDMSDQINILERNLQNTQSLLPTEELQKCFNHQQIFTPQPVHPLRDMVAGIQCLLDSTHICDSQQTGLTSPLCSETLGRSPELSYLNLTPYQSLSDLLGPPSVLVITENTTS